MIKNKIYIIAALYIFSFGLGNALADADLAIAGNAACSSGAFYDALAQSESGGCGTNQYDCMGPTISDPKSMHYGDKPIGKYQFMPKTLVGMGIDPVAFSKSPAMQEQTIQTFVANNASCLSKPYTTKSGKTYPPATDAIGTTINGVQITMSGLVGAAHLSGCGGARRMIRTSSSGSSDQLGTSALAYAGKFQGYGIMGDPAGITCGGGVPNAAGVFAQAQADGLHNLIGCDPAILDVSKARVDALRQQEIEAAKAIIVPQTPIEQGTCLDQQTEVWKAPMKIFSNETKPNTSIASVVQQPLKDTMSQFFTGNLAGSAASLVNQQFTNVSKSFHSAIGSTGLGGGLSVPTIDCPTKEMIWDMPNCLPVVNIPSISDLIGGQINALTGAIASAPQRLFDKACQGIKSKLGAQINDATDVFENAAKKATQPLSDAATSVTNATN